MTRTTFLAQQLARRYRADPAAMAVMARARTGLAGHVAAGTMTQEWAGEFFMLLRLVEKMLGRSAP